MLASTLVVVALLNPTNRAKILQLAESVTEPGSDPIKQSDVPIDDPEDSSQVDNKAAAQLREPSVK